MEAVFSGLKHLRKFDAHESNLFAGRTCVKMYHYKAKTFLYKPSNYLGMC